MTAFALTTALLLAVGSGTSPGVFDAQPESAFPQAPASRCALMNAGAEKLATRDCMACHGGAEGPHLRSMHPVDVAQDGASAKLRRGGSSLRSAEEVVRRGLFLPDGRISCLTCHDARSRWAARLVVPPGASVRTLVDRRNGGRAVVLNAAMAAQTLPVGTAIEPTELCRACHVIGD
jgi:cytochrome c peroxidase